MVYRDYEGRILFLRREKDPIKTLALRAIFVLIIFLMIVAIFWYHRGDLHDSQDGDVSFLDVIYFTFITITTVGYGDIVPVTEPARIIDAVIVTPLRIIVWLTFLGTAYEFIIPRYMEGYRLKKLQSNLSRHFIVVGYGSTGKAVAEELVHNGNEKGQIIVLDKQKDRTEEAAADGFIAIRGDAAREETLKKVVVTKARHIIVATGKDDTNVLVVLTARHMNKDINIVARANLEENDKLLSRGGADIVITPLVTGGKLMAASTLWKTASLVLEDILSAKHGLRVMERRVKPNEIGKRPKTLPGIVVLAVRRGKRIMDPPQLDDVKLKADDVMVTVQDTSDGSITASVSGPEPSEDEEEEDEE